MEKHISKYENIFINVNINLFFKLQYLLINILEHMLSHVLSAVTLGPPSQNICLYSEKSSRYVRRDEMSAFIVRLYFDKIVTLRPIFNLKYCSCFFGNTKYPPKIYIYE